MATRVTHASSGNAAAPGNCRSYSRPGSVLARIYVLEEHSDIFYIRKDVVCRGRLSVCNVAWGSRRGANHLSFSSIFYPRELEI